MQYKFTKCPHCGHLVEAWKPTGLNDIEEQIGMPIGVCTKCKRVYDTGKKAWQDMDIFERLIVYGRIAFGAIFGGLVAGVLLLLPLMFLNTHFKWIESNDAYRTATYTCLFLGIACSAWSHLSHLKQLQ